MNIFIYELPLLFLVPIVFVCVCDCKNGELDTPFRKRVFLTESSKKGGKDTRKLGAK